MDADNNYSKAPECGDGSSFFQNPTVGLFYEGKLLAEWKTPDKKDGKTGKDPLPPLDLSGKENFSGLITSPGDGEQVCGQVEIVARPQTEKWEIQWAHPGENSW